VEGERIDLLHTLPLTGAFSSIKTGQLQDTMGSDIIVITAGIPRQAGESRLDLLKKNTKIMKEILSELPKGKDPILFIVSNPVDPLTYLAATSFNPRKVIGLGTFLDSVRFRSYLGEILNMLPSRIDALILGEHGDSMVPIWSHVKVDSIKLQEFRILSKEEKEKILEDVKQSGSLLNKTKGGTSWGVAVSSLEVIDILMKGKRCILPVSSLVKDYCGIYDVSFSVPTILSNGVIESHIRLFFDDEEIK
jgi:L-lactate dehydrogenase